MSRAECRGRVVVARVGVDAGPLAAILVPLGWSHRGRCCGCRTSPPAAPGTATRATTCSCSGRWSATASCPLLGPPTSIGDVHHGALYYYLLAPAAALTGGDSPLAVVFLIALAGIAAVAVTWWLARSIAGPVAGLRGGAGDGDLAGLDRRIDVHLEPEPDRAVERDRAGRGVACLDARVELAWWLLAAVGTAVTMQCHVLGVTLLPIVGALFVADVRRRAPAAGAADHRCAPAWPGWA